MRQHNRRDRRRLQPHEDSKCSPLRFLSLNSNSLGFVIPSEARDLQFAAKCRSLASLGMTNHESEARTRPQQTLRSSSLNRKQEWLLERLRDPAQKTRSIGAIDQPVIVRE